MSNANVRSLRDKFQVQQQPQQKFVASRRETEWQFQCSHCGKEQTISIRTKDPIESSNDDPRLRFASRQVSNRSDDDANDELLSPLQRTNYKLDFRHPSKTLEENIGGMVENCVRSSVHQVSYLNQTGKGPEIVEVEVEYDPLLGNVKSTRKRSSTMVTNLDDEHSSRFRPISLVDSQRDKTPIWARRRISHSTVKPSDLIREHDKREKLEATALRRLSRADLSMETVRSMASAANKSTVNQQNPSMIKETILRWCQDLTQFYKGVHIANFSSSWSDGLAFCAIVHRYFPDEFNFETLIADEARKNCDLAFTVALQRAGIEPLIDTDDMIAMGKRPDWKVVFTYVQSLYRHLSRFEPPAMMRERW